MVLFFLKPQSFLLCVRGGVGVVGAGHVVLLLLRVHSAEWETKEVFNKCLFID